MKLQARFGQVARVMACGLLVGLLAACGKYEPPAQFKTEDAANVGIQSDWQMADADGKMRSIADFKGKVVYLFFGYARCPDACPTTMFEMSEVKELLGADGDKFQVIFVTVDPERDTPEIMREYIGSFDPDGLALVGTPEQVKAMAKKYKVYYAKVDGTTPETYTIDHSVGGYIYDPAGKLRRYSKYGTPAEDVAADVRLLLNGK